MKKVIIIGGGIAGLTAGVYLQKAGFTTEIYEKNAVVGGMCTAWKREGFRIDNCIHWLTGTKEGTGLHDLWNEIGAIGEGIELRKKDMFFTSETNGQKVTFWRDIERTRKELLELSPEDTDEINKLITYTKLSESVTVPVDKPFDMMNPIELVKMGMSMKDMGKVMKEYGNIDVYDLANRFKHPAIKSAIIDYMPPGYQAYAFLVSYATVVAGNGDIPRGGSFAMVMRIADKYRSLGGTIYTNSPVKEIVMEKNIATGIRLENRSNSEDSNGKSIENITDENRFAAADYVICACDTDYTFHHLLPEDRMPSSLQKLYEDRKAYPVSSSFQVAFAVDEVTEDMKGVSMFSCRELQIANSKIVRMSTNCYDYEPDFAPEGKTVLQSNLVQTVDDYNYWKELYKDQNAYKAKKQEIAKEIESRIIDKYPNLDGKIRLLDAWTPITYNRYCNSYKGAYMSFVMTKNAKNLTVPGKIKGINNVFIASQWQMGPGGLPVAAAMGKFAAYRVQKAKSSK